MFHFDTRSWWELFQPNKAFSYFLWDCTKNWKWVAVVRAAFVPRVYDLQIPSIQQVTKKIAAFLIYVTQRREIPGVYRNSQSSTGMWGVMRGRELCWRSSWEEPFNLESQNGLGGTSKGLLVQPLAMSRDIFSWIRSLRASSRLGMFLGMGLPPLWATCASVTKTSSSINWPEWGSLSRFLDSGDKIQDFSMGK